MDGAALEGEALAAEMAAFEAALKPAVDSPEYAGWVKAQKVEAATHCVVRLTLEQFETLHPNINLGQE